MPRISYVDPATIDDPELRAAIEQARLHGTPRPESQAVRAHSPEVLRTFSRFWAATFREGVLDHKLKELCRLYVSKTVECSYCGGQRSEAARMLGLEESAVDELLVFDSSDAFDEREKVALRYTRAIAWNPDEADDALWADLHRHFDETELVELGSFIALTSGQQRWIKTLGIGHREVLGDTDAGLAATGQTGH
ncbi:MAG TPA: carboxymuconolactone decarboxylase family protein [Gaiellaceae bacterium]|nr:carboxymuconolactone decarboxylase family protein [Gaiellaceae bacterium]